MAYLQLRRIAILLAFAAVCVYAEKHASSIASMSIPEIEDKLQVSEVYSTLLDSTELQSPNLALCSALPCLVWLR